MKLTDRDVALIVFVALVAVDLLGLLLDLALEQIGLRTVTDWVELYPLLGVPIVAAQCLLPVSIGAHFWWD